MRLRGVYVTMMLYVHIQQYTVDAFYPGWQGITLPPPRVTLGQSCAPPDEEICGRALHGVCDDTTALCGCDTGYYAIDIYPAYMCMKFPVGVSCAGGSRVCDYVTNTVCSDNDNCTCITGWFGLKGAESCTEVKIGADCSGDLAPICDLIDNVVCDSGTSTCACKQHYHAASSGKTCEEQGVSVRCSKTNDEIVMEIRTKKDDKHQQIVTMKSTTELITSKCKSSTVTADKNFLELKIAVNIGTREQTSPNKADSDCFVIADDAVTTKVNVLVVGQSDANYIQVTDKYYKAVCDVETANGGVVSLPNFGIISHITPKEKTSEADDVTLELAKADDNTALGTSVSLTEEVKLKVTLTRKAFVTEPLGLFLKNMYVSDNADLSATTTKKLRMLNQYGCVEDNPVFKPKTTFVPADPNLVAESADKFETLTGKFNLALFDGMAEFKLFFSVEYEASCFVNTEDKCFDLVSYCTDNIPPSRRRRRSVTGVKNGTVTLGVSLDLGGNRRVNLDHIGSGITTPEECSTSGYFWIVAGVLGCLALAALLFAVLLFCRLKLEHWRSDTMDDKFSARNPAF